MNPPKVTKKLAVSNFKTRLKVVSFWILALGVVYFIYFCLNMFPVISGYGAKSLCSCVYVQGRNEKDVINQELGTILGKFGSFSIDKSDSSAAGSVFGMFRKKAIYRKGLGCTLVNGITEEELRAQTFVGKTAVAVNQDTIAWPNGNLLPDSFPANINKEALDKLVADQFVEADPQNPINTRAILVLYKGAILSEKYATGFDANVPQMGWSMNKSVMNALIGILVQQEGLKVDAPAPVPAWEQDKRSKITINNLLQASSGLDWAEVYNRPSDATEMLFRSKDAALYAYSVKAYDEPNEKFVYSSGTTNILSWIARQKIGEDRYHRFPYQKLFNRIGMYSALLEPDPSGTYVMSSFGYATARDWARFGLLYLNDGVWNGERILPEGWVKYSTTPAPAAPQGEYGAQWWLNAKAVSYPHDSHFPDLPIDTFLADGYEGQAVFVIPSKNLVVVRLGLSQKADPDMNTFIAEVIKQLPQ